MTRFFDDRMPHAGDGAPLRPKPQPSTPLRPRLLRASGMVTLALVGALTLGGLAGHIAPAPALAELQQQRAEAEYVVGWADLVEQVQPAVVNVSTTREVTRQRQSMDPREFFPFDPEGGDSPFERFMRRFFDDPSGPGPQVRPEGEQPREPRSQRVQGVGSGFIIDPDGYVVTNHHVVDGADRLEVTLVDGRRFQAELVGTDSRTDLALLRIETDEALPYVAFGDSDAMRVGEPILAVGNPFGLGGTVTAGIVSALGRDIGAGPYDDFMQIDAAINRGNSGGPTFNRSGEVVGVNSAIYSPTGTYVGIGFAIPSNLATSIIDDLRMHGTVERGWLGVHIQSIDPEIAESLGLDAPQGALVTTVNADSPAAAAGIERGDVILRFDDARVDEMRDLPRLVARVRPGTTSEVTVWREGEEVVLSVDLGRMPGEQELAALPPAEDAVDSAELGMELAALTPDLRAQYGIADAVEGVLVRGVESGSPAAERGVRTGDVIMEVQRQPVTSPSEVARATQESIEAGQSSVLILVQRDGNDRYVALPLTGA